MLRLAPPFHRLVLPLACVDALLGCGSSLSEIPRGPHPQSGGAVPVVVDSEPPPPQIETVNESPSSECRWADGHWEWQDNEWAWTQGGWVRLEQDCYYAQSSLVWVAAVNQPGALFFTPGEWYFSDTRTPCPPPEPCTTASPTP